MGTRLLIIRILAVAGLVIAAICAAGHTTILGADWPIWALPAFALWAAEPVLLAL
jgi:hypothetical protein